MKLTIARLTLELVSPLHIGSGLQSADTDAPVVRDAFGDYRIPGSSLAGALRAHCGPSLESAWGSAGSENRASAIEVSDAFLIDWDGTTTLTKRLAGKSVAFPTFKEIQDHVRIDHASGAAEDGKKFDAEIVPQGTRFRCELALIERDDSSTARDAFTCALHALDTGAIALGGDVCSGLGLIRVLRDSYTIATFDLATAAGLANARNRPAALDQPAALDAKPTQISACGLSTATATADTVSGSVRIAFRTDGPLLVGGSQRPSNKSDADRNFGADLVFGEARVADYAKKALVAKPWIPGSSLRGAIRHRVWHIFEALGCANVQQRVDDLFGSVAGERASASKIRVTGQFLEQHPRTLVQHVAIDRLTGGSLTGALYAEAPIWRDDLVIQVGLTLHGIALDEAAALTHALIDMGIGELAIGGGTRRGNGRLLFDSAKGAAGYQGKAVTFNLEWNGKSISNASPPSELQALIDALESANETLVGATANA